MRLTFCGVRGSTRAPGAEFLGYGGHTSCVAVSHDASSPALVVDAGTGLRRVSGLWGDAAFEGIVDRIPTRRVEVVASEEGMVLEL